MKFLMIKDLSLAEELDRKAMAAVRGGIAYNVPLHTVTWDDWVKALPPMLALPEMPALPGMPGKMVPA